MKKPFLFEWEDLIQAYLRRSKIKHRLIASLLILSIIPLFTTSWLSYFKSINAISSKISGYSLEVLDQLKYQIQRENNKLEYLSDQIMMHNLVQTSLLNTSADVNAESLRSSYYDINQAFSGRKLLDQIKSLQIYNSANELIYDLGYDKLRHEDVRALAASMKLQDGKDIWAHTVTQYGVDCIVLARTIRSQSNWLEEIGFVFIAMKESYYSRDIYENIDLGEGADLFIMNDEGAILSSRNPNYPVGSIYPEQSLFQQISNYEAIGERAFSAKLQHMESLIVYSYDSNSKWYLIGIIPKSYLNKESSQILPFILLVVCLCLLFSFLFTYLISRSISNPLNRLMHQIKQVSMGNFRAHNKDNSNDELGFLSGKFNSMVDQIDGLIAQLNNEQQMKRETELQMLQAQINPHFLFNTLNSLKWTATLNQATNVSVGLSALAQLLRNTIVDKKEFIPLQKEIENIDYYIIIQRLRFGTSFSVTYNIDDRLLQASVLKFILQPIVENALIHGLDEMDDNGQIIISAIMEERDMQIIINDNGKGMNELQVQRLFNPFNKAGQRLSSIGLSNVQERLRLHYGEQYGLIIHSKIGIGTMVSFKIPITEVGSNDEGVNR